METSAARLFAVVVSGKGGEASWMNPGDGDRFGFRSAKLQQAARLLDREAHQPPTLGVDKGNLRASFFDFEGDALRLVFIVNHETGEGRAQLCHRGDGRVRRQSEMGAQGDQFRLQAFDFRLQLGRFFCQGFEVHGAR